MKKKTNQYLIGSQFVLTIFIALVLAIVTLSGSYALFTNKTNDKDYNTFKEENLEVSYVDTGEGNGDVLSLVNQEPVKDELWENITPYRFDVTNTGETEKNYQIKIELDSSIISEDNCSSKGLSFYAIKIKMDNQEPIILGTLETKDYIVYESSQPLIPGSSEIHEIRIWIDENSVVETKEKHFHGKVIIEEKETKTYEEYKKGQVVTLKDGSEYHVLEDSDETTPKVKLFSDHSLLESGIQDTNCIINSFINENISNNKIKDTSEKYYCSTQEYKNLNEILYAKYYSVLKNNDLIESKMDIRLPLKDEIKNSIETDTTINEWTMTSNYWLMDQSIEDNKIWAVYLDGEDEKIILEEKDSKYYGIRPVIIIEKALLK